MQRLVTLNLQFKAAAASSSGANKREKRVWEALSIDRKMSPRAVGLRKATQQLMERSEERFQRDITATTWPDWVFPEIASLGVNGLQIKDFGGPGLTHLEAGSIIFEMAKIDGSVAMSFLVQNCLGMAVVDELGDDQ